MNTMMDSKEELFLQKLRTATAVQHKQLEATSLSAALLQPDVTLSTYAAYLAHMRGVIAFAEQSIFPRLVPLFADMFSRHKLPAIDSDLAVLAAQVPVPQVKAYAAALPNDSIATALGYMYVIEGSTLGGRVLLKHINSTLGLDAQHGARFFAGYGAATGTMWKHFLTVFSSYAVREGCEDEIIAGSNHAFSAIEKHFSQQAQ